MTVYACEPRGLDWSRWPPLYPAFCVWLWRDFTEILSWDRYAYIIVQTVFPQIVPPDRHTVKKWYEDHPTWPEKITKIGFPSPEVYFEQWRIDHPDEVRKIEAIALLVKAVRSKSRGVQAQEYYGPVTPVYFPQPQPYVFGNDVVRQVCGAMSRVMTLATVVYCAKQCAKVAMS